MKTRPLWLIMTSAVLAIGAAGVTAQSATASNEISVPELEAEVASVLREFPGGTRTAENEISWEGGAVVLTIELESNGLTPLAVGTCPTGSYCAFAGAGLFGSRLTFWTCDTTVSTGALGGANSFANARSTGYVQARNSSGGVLATAYAGGWSNAASASTLRCVS